ncbi:MAG: NAD-dependent epimerase/dehydratase family protein, partial [Bacteroidetes bacterium]|nr:NAD-dependent epimerase/dehydratase family protein [Bacteroidota bacterium]
MLIGATGTIGSAVLKDLATRHDIVSVGRNSGDIHADIADQEALREMYLKAGEFDAVLCAAGLAAFGSLTALTDEDYQLGLESKLMGQINLVRLGISLIADAGSFTLT